MALSGGTSIMSRVRTFGFALLTSVCLGVPVAALASTKCLCNNGEITESMDDDSDACDDACDMFGGGRAWTPADAADEGGDSATVDRNTPVRDDVSREVQERRVERNLR